MKRRSSWPDFRPIPQFLSLFGRKNQPLAKVKLTAARLERNLVSTSGGKSEMCQGQTPTKLRFDGLMLAAVQMAVVVVGVGELQEAPSAERASVASTFVLYIARTPSLVSAGLLSRDEQQMLPCFGFRMVSGRPTKGGR